MAQLERSSTTHEYARNPQSHDHDHAHAHAQSSPMIKQSHSHSHAQTQASPMVRQHLQENASSGWESKSSSPIYDRNYDHNKKSVFTKVKEKAKQLRHSLSGKKKHGMGIHDDNNTNHSQDFKYEHAEEDDEDADYFGAPMYESQMAPKSIKQNSGQLQSADQVIPGNLALPHDMHTEVKLERQKSTSPSKSITETVSDATHNLASKIDTGLAITNPTPQDTNVAALTTAGSRNVEGLKNSESTPQVKEHSANSPTKYDIGVSVKEYFVRKNEPGEDTKASSQPVSASSSPGKSPRQKGVVDKFRDVVSSLLWTQEQSDSTTMDENKSLKNPEYNPEDPSPNVPVPTSISEEIEGKSHGRVLQTN